MRARHRPSGARHLRVAPLAPGNRWCSYGGRMTRSAHARRWRHLRGTRQHPDRGGRNPAPHRSGPQAPHRSYPSHRGAPATEHGRAPRGHPDLTRPPRSPRSSLAAPSARRRTRDRAARVRPTRAPVDPPRRRRGRAWRSAAGRKPDGARRSGGARRAPLLNRPAVPAVGYVVGGHLAGRLLRRHRPLRGMRDLATGLDVALLPVWGWGPRVGPGHLDPERAARAAGLLAPRVVVPIHWGTLAGPRVWWRADPAMPARAFAKLAAAARAERRGQDPRPRRAPCSRRAGRVLMRAPN